MVSVNVRMVSSNLVRIVGLSLHVHLIRSGNSTDVSVEKDMSALTVYAPLKIDVKSMKGM